MKIVLNFLRIAAYLGASGSLLLGWMEVLARLGISSENVTPAMAMISIPFMLWTGLLRKTSPPRTLSILWRGGAKSPSPRGGEGFRVRL